MSYYFGLYLQISGLVLSDFDNDFFELLHSFAFLRGPISKGEGVIFFRKSIGLRYLLALLGVDVETFIRSSHELVLVKTGIIGYDDLGVDSALLVGVYCAGVHTYSNNNKDKLYYFDLNQVVISPKRELLIFVTLKK